MSGRYQTSVRPHQRDITPASTRVGTPLFRITSSLPEPDRSFTHSILGDLSIDGGDNGNALFAYPGQISFAYLG